MKAYPGKEMIFFFKWVASNDKDGHYTVKTFWKSSYPASGSILSMYYDWDRKKTALDLGTIELCYSISSPFEPSAEVS